MEYDFINLISTIGFPIVAFLLIYLDLRKLINNQNETLIKLITKIEIHMEKGK